ncbi:WD40 repeat domain-containing protein [Deinococcus sp. MIMF12]|uniref:WD40 repeat domain-containing protein n=1 Tax=Deinococcus rhizophilus TaxID=3049544 RepID=A0ABT7JEL5_9DEIO|nr:WD40 repeat domain-containing protein [Deinococcus rhizophilus]MDL2343499.1 WD40 repeat domain-containing protein [Deinococcus rhizophilus]
MTPAPGRSRPTRLQRVLMVLLTPLLLFNLVGIARAVWDSRPVQTWRAQRTGLPVYLRGGGLYEGLDHAAQSPDGRWVAIGGTREYGESFTARLALWEAATMRRRWTTDLPTNDFRSVNALVWSPDSRTVWIHDDEGRVTALDAAGGGVRGEWRSFEWQPCVFAALPQGLLLTDAAGPGRDRPVRLTLRRWSDGAVVWRVPFTCWWEAGGSVDAAGSTLAYSPRRGEVALYDLRTRRPRPERFTLGSGEEGPYSLALTPDGSRVAAGWKEGTLTVWDGATGREVWRARPHRGLVRALAWNPAGTALASAAFHGCGGWRSECVVVTRAAPDGPHSRVVWSRRYNVPDTVQWLGPDRLLLGEEGGSRVVAVPGE